MDELSTRLCRRQETRVRRAQKHRENSALGPLASIGFDFVNPAMQL